MTPHFLPTLINRPFNDPGVYLDFLFARRAMLFDLGDLRPLGARKLLRVSDIFISHTHIDHFIGFDALLRIMLGREKRVNLFGPPGILQQVENRLASYSWNLIQSYPTTFVLTVCELHPDGTRISADFSSSQVFAREHERASVSESDVILDEENLLVRVAFLDHSIPCLAYAFEEKLHVNFMKNRLDELGAPVGPWLSEVKQAVLRGEGDDTVFNIGGAGAGDAIGAGEGRALTLRELKERVLTVVPGEKIAYVTDVAFTPQNRERIVALAQGADYFFIEAVFLDVDSDRARERAHLTTRQAGGLAREAQAVRVIPFHFSPRHLYQEEELCREVEAAFQGR